MSLIWENMKTNKTCFNPFRVGLNLILYILTIQFTQLIGKSLLGHREI